MFHEKVLIHIKKESIMKLITLTQGVLEIYNLIWNCTLINSCLFIDISSFHCQIILSSFVGLLICKMMSC